MASSKSLEPVPTLDIEDYPLLTDVVAPDYKPVGHKWREYRNETDDGGCLVHAYSNGVKPDLNRKTRTFQQHYFRHWVTDFSLVDTVANYAGIADLMAWNPGGEFLVLNWTVGNPLYPETAGQLVALGASDSYLRAEELRSLSAFPVSGFGLRIYDNIDQIVVDPTNTDSDSVGYFEAFQGIGKFWHWTRR